MRDDGGRLEQYCRLGAGIGIVNPEALNVSSTRVGRKNRKRSVGTHDGENVRCRCIVDLKTPKRSQKWKRSWYERELSR